MPLRTWVRSGSAWACLEIKWSKPFKYVPAESQNPNTFEALEAEGECRECLSLPLLRAVHGGAGKVAAANLTHIRTRKTV